MKRHASRLFASLIALLLFSPFLYADKGLERRLKQAYEKYPEADTNKDGVLSLEEAKAHRDKLRAAKGGSTEAKSRAEIRPRVAKSQTKVATFENGARCLFLGHSFFIPVAKTFDELALANGFQNHHAEFVMSGGGGGAPGRIWNSPKHRAAATKILEAGNIDLIGMTYYDESHCSVEDYSRWIDLAVKHSPNVRVFVGLCWPDAPAESPREFSEILGTVNERLFKTVTTLRDRYPETKIQFVNYGKVASELKNRHSEGELPQIRSLIGRDANSLFRDQKGHAGPLLRELAALTWLQHLYSADMDEMESTALKSKDATSVLSTVSQFNTQFK